MWWDRKVGNEADETKIWERKRCSLVGKVWGLGEAPAEAGTQTPVHCREQGGCEEGSAGLAVLRGVATCEVQRKTPGPLHTKEQA